MHCAAGPSQEGGATDVALGAQLGRLTEPIGRRLRRRRFSSEDPEAGPQDLHTLKTSGAAYILHPELTGERESLLEFPNRGSTNHSPAAAQHQAVACTWTKAALQPLGSTFEGRGELAPLPGGSIGASALRGSTQILCD